AEAETPLSAGLADLPQYVSTPEIRVDCTHEDKFRVVSEGSAYFRSKDKTIDVDGVPILFPSGWGLGRGSHTQPLLLGRFEADTRDHLESIQAVVRDQLRQYPSVRLDF